MTYRTALFLAAGTAAFMSANPILAGTSTAFYMPNLHFVEQNEVPTRAGLAPLPVCTQLEKSAQVDPAECGTNSREELAKIKSELDD